MKRLTLILLALLLMVAPVAAQDGPDEIELETWTSEDEAIRFDYPANWWVYQAETGDPSVLVTNSRRLAIYTENRADLENAADEPFVVQPKEYALALSFVPQALVHESLQINAVMDADELLKLLEFLFEGDDERLLIDADVIEVRDDLDIATLAFTNDDDLGMMVMMFPLDEVYVWVFVVAHLDDMLELSEHTGLILASLELDTNADFLERATTSADTPNLLDMMAQSASSLSAN